MEVDVVGLGLALGVEVLCCREMILLRGFIDLEGKHKENISSVRIWYGIYACRIKGV